MKQILLFLVGSSCLALPRAAEFQQYVWANYKQFNQAHPEAQEIYESLIGSGSDHAYKGYIHFLQETNQWDKIVALIEKYDALFASDLSVQMIFAQALEQTGEQDRADERLVKLYDAFKNNQDVTLNVAQMYLRRKEPENALKVLDAYLLNASEKMNNFIFYYIKSQILVQLNRKQDALASIRKSLDLYPKFDKSWLLLAILEEQAGRIEQAVQGYMNFLRETTEPKTEIQSHLSQLAVKHNLSLTSLSGKVSDFERAKLLVKENKFDKALELIDDCIKKEPKNEQYRILKIDILATTQHYMKAAHLLKQWIEAEPDNELWYKTMHLLGTRGLDQHHLINMLREIEKRDPENVLPVMYLADLYVRTEHAYGASYLKKSAKMTRDPLMKAKILYQLALFHYSKKQMREAKQALLSVYALTQDFLPAMNLLAYYYASKEKNLAHAYLMIEQILLKEPDNPHYLDTKAFILYKQGNYEQAKAILERCFEKQPRDLTIVRHLAKTNYQLGNARKAKSLIDEIVKLDHVNEAERRKLITLSDRWKNATEL